MTADLTTLLARASVHASLIEGGVELSSYPAHCKLCLERRTLPGETGRQVEADAAFIAAAGIPTVLFGPGGEGAHAIEEWVSLSDTEAVAQTLVRLAARFCA